MGGEPGRGLGRETATRRSSGASLEVPRSRSPQTSSVGGGRAVGSALVQPGFSLLTESAPGRRAGRGALLVGEAGHSVCLDRAE